MAKKEYTNKKMLEIICKQIYGIEDVEKYKVDELIGLIALHVGSTSDDILAEFRKLLKHVNKMDIKTDHVYDLYANYVSICNKWKEHIDFVANNGNSDEFIRLQIKYRNMTQYLITNIEKLEDHSKCTQCGMTLKSGEEVAEGRIRTRGTKIHICNSCLKMHIKNLELELDNNDKDNTKDAFAKYIAQHIKY